MPPARRDLPRGGHVLVDETKARTYLMVAVWVAPADLPHVRRQLRALLPSGQIRLHFQKLTNSRRRAVVAELRRLGIRAAVVSVRAPSRGVRDQCLGRVLTLASERGAVRVVIETDESLVHADIAVARDVSPDVELVHLRSAQEPVLWASDAIAWCLQRGRVWKAGVVDLVVPLA